MPVAQNDALVLRAGRRVHPTRVVIGLLCLLAACGPGARSVDDAGTDAARECVGAACNRDVLPSRNDAGDDDAGPMIPACNADADCDDRVFCNGVERCEAGRCVPAVTGACEVLTCDEPSRRCDCHADRDGIAAWFCDGRDADADGDGVDAIERGGEDCDDRDPKRYPGNAEVCDYTGYDEDCSFETVGTFGDALSDGDGDSYIDIRCINIDPATGKIFHAPDADCDDAIPEVHPGPDSQDFCDDKDNDCDGHIDEIEGEGVDFASQSFYCRDADGDGWAVKSDVVQRCGPPIGYLLCNPRQRDDCDDREAAVHPTALEVCNGLDDDCDHLVDQPSEGSERLADEATFGDETTALCDVGSWRITACPADRLWCDESTIARGCETDATRLSYCHSCVPTGCRYACGTTECDDVVELALGNNHSCARSREGRVACWGRGADGRLGTDTTASAAVPTPVDVVQDARAIAAGADHTCAIVGDERTLYCWGSHLAGQLGTQDQVDFSAVPLAVLGVETPRMTAVHEVAAGERHTCAIVGEMRELLCWGVSLDTDTVEQGSEFARQVAGPGGDLPIFDARHVAVGKLHACVIDINGDVLCWGDNKYGQLGVPASAEAARFHAEPVAGVTQATAITAGEHHTCVVRGEMHELVCWGLNGDGQLGRVGSSEDYVAQPVPGLRDVVSVAAGNAFTCAATASGTLRCWGSNYKGERGDEAYESRPEATRLVLQSVIRVDAGAHACAITSDQGVHCWGDNFYGALGSGMRSEAEQAEPLPVGPLVTSKP